MLAYLACKGVQRLGTRARLGIANCTPVIHTLRGALVKADGDTHGWLKVDPQFQDLLNPGNITIGGGNLVFEIVCRFSVTQAGAQPACASYHSPIAIPSVGSHVRIVGSYVRDTNHAKWMEIHPVSSITVV